MSGVAATSFVVGGLWLAITIGAAVLVGGLLEGEGPEAEEVRAASLQFVWTIGLVLVAGNLLAGVGLSMQQPWGKAMAWVMVPWSLVLVPVGTGMGIYHIIALPKHA